MIKNPMKLLLAGALIAILGCELAILSTWGMPEPTGIWKDVNDDYYVSFMSDGTYVESIYGMPKKFEVVDNKLLLENVNGQQTVTQLSKNFGGTLTVLLNGETHILEPSSRTPQFGTQTLTSELPQAAYKLCAEFSQDATLKLYPELQFKYELGHTEVTGKYAYAENGDLLLFGSEDFQERLRSWDRGFALGQLTTDLEYDILKENIFENRGYALRGTVVDESTQTDYSFSSNGTVVRTVSDGSVTEFMYYASMDGLVTLTDSVGLNETVTLWYDVGSNEVYRYVFARDGWTDYLLQSGGEVE